ncbi:hypothetical protein AK830_g10466 [Neonectria ditissima]|uniref:Zn(2)-C6 fungal-type domain-containing protein n=1 Tax=Neonectria ditissima TaxID=78410 RepID=A0A0P7BAG8_9HYPO|nr:hypothetical protein AK830_g10466 [Neonectria ditissima]
MNSLSPLTLRKMDRVAASRQKSCNTCVRGKRKCDKKTPRCTRCAAKGLECIYQKLPPGASFHDEDIGVASANEVPDFDMGFDIEGLSTSTSTTTTTTTATTSPESLHNNASSLPSSIELDSNLDFSIIDHLMANDSSAGAELWNLGEFGGSAGHNNKLEMPLVPAQPPVAIRDVTLLPDMDSCLAFNPLDVHDPSTRIGYVVDVMTNLYRGFAHTRALPFVHPRLYGSSLPRTILAAFSAAAAYAGRTPENKAWVYKLVTEAARDIHREGERAHTPAEKVARVQALVVLDSIRMFDGDVALRAASERETPQFVLWLTALRDLKNELEQGVSPVLLMSRDRPPASWEGWILLESARRTLMMAMSFLCVSYILKSLEPPCDIMETGLAFTASRHLWEATSSIQFFQAWHMKPQFCVPDMDFKDVWMHARPDDVDEFSRVMLTAQSGPDVMEYFMLGNANISVGGRRWAGFSLLKPCGITTLSKHDRQTEFLHNVHAASCAPGEVTFAVRALRTAPFDGRKQLNDFRVRSVQQYRKCLKVSYTINTDLRQLTFIAMALGASLTLLCGHAFTERITELFNPLMHVGMTWWFLSTMVTAMATLVMAGLTFTALGVYLDMQYDEEAITRWGEEFSHEEAMGRASIFSNRLWALIPFGVDLWFR